MVLIAPVTTAAPPASGPQAGRPLTEGERWATDALTTLRAAGFPPAAIIRFLQESLDRAADTRDRRRGLASQARRWSIAGAGAALALREALSHPGAGAPSRRTLLTWCAIQAAMLDWHLGMVEGLDGHPRSHLSAADALTLGRGGLAPFAAAAPPNVQWYLLLLAAAGASDLLDGRLAQRAETLDELVEGPHVLGHHAAALCIDQLWAAMPVGQRVGDPRCPLRDRSGG